jgi:membrane protein DedA with SNARE-associated domain
MTLAALFSVPHNLGYVALGALIGLETMGVPLPGETALIAAGILASEGHLEIELVILVSACAAIIGDNVGFWIGRSGGRKLLELPGPLQHHRARVLERGEQIFERHGGKTVFFGRWFSGLRIASAWLAGVHRMPWGTFIVYNAAGGIAWSVSVALFAYWVGESAGDVLKVVGVGGLGVALVVLGAFVFWRWRRRRAQEA